MSKKQKIIQASIQVFKEKGIEKTKISDIVKVAGIAQGTFYLYFPSKLSVMPAIAEVMVDKTIAAVIEKVDKTAGFSLKLRQVVQAIFEINRDYREIQALIYAGLSSSEHIREWETVYQPFYSWISDFLQHAKEEGEIRATLNIERTSKIVIGLVESAAEQIYLYDNRKDDSAEEQMNEVLDFLYYALGMRN